MKAIVEIGGKQLKVEKGQTFIVISFFAIYQSTQTSKNKNIKIALWMTWFVFFISILNKTIQLFYISNYFIYSAGILLALLHLYNLKYCQCKDESCCVNKSN